MIVDASVASHWFVETEFSEAAAPFRTREDLIAPGFLLLETANVLYKRCRRGELAAGDLEEALSILQALMAELVPDLALLPHAAALALDVQTPRL
jgi:predicted nucleic acid-binding protein